MAQHIKQLLDGVIIKQNNWKLTLLHNWHAIVGTLSSRVTIEKIFSDTIVLGVYNSSWMQELYVLSPLLIKKINENLDQPHIKQIRFKQIGRKKKYIKKINKKKSATKQVDIHLNSAEKTILNRIDDPILRKALEAFRIRCYRERE